MARGAKIIIQKEILVWAREAIGFDLEKAAEKTKIDKESIKKWESEDSEIFLSDIKKIARAYKRQLSFFFLPSAPKEKPIPSYFRTLDSVKHDEISEKVRIAIRRAQANRKFIDEFFDKEYELRVNIPISLSANPTETAEKFRKIFEIKKEEQFNLREPKKALAFWISKVEAKGIPVFQMDLDTNFRGFCLRENDLSSVIVVNSKDEKSARIFTIIHELCHLFIRQDEIDQLIYSRGEKKAHTTIEAFANEFAGSFLVPNILLQSEKSFSKYKDTKSDDYIVELSKKFGVSREVIFRRMHVLTVISKDYYEAKIKELRKKYEQFKLQEKMRLRATDSNKFSRNVPKETLQKVGFSLGSKAFHAVSDGRMTTFELIRFFDVKAKHVSKMQGILEKKYVGIV
jgi:Zn-dependent peptidase ImmA (M78 family)